MVLVMTTKSRKYKEWYRTFEQPQYFFLEWAWELHMGLILALHYYDNC